MPAPRNCTKCGAALPGAVRWCGQCYEPVREFTPRAPLHQGDFVGTPRSRSDRSRWQASETAFGPVGRIALTVAVIVVLAAGIVMAFSAPVMLFLMPTAVIPGGALLVWVLRDTWQPVRTDATPYRSPGVKLADVADAVRPPSFREMSRGRRWAVAAGATGYAALVVAYFQLPDDWQVGFMMFLGLLGTGLLAATVLRRD